MTRSSLLKTKKKLYGMPALPGYSLLVAEVGVCAWLVVAQFFFFNFSCSSVEKTRLYDERQHARLLHWSRIIRLGRILKAGISKNQQQKQGSMKQQCCIPYLESFPLLCRIYAVEYIYPPLRGLVLTGCFLPPDATTQHGTGHVTRDLTAVKFANAPFILFMCNVYMVRSIYVPMPHTCPLQAAEV